MACIYIISSSQSFCSLVLLFERKMKLRGRGKEGWEEREREMFESIDQFQASTSIYITVFFFIFPFLIISKLLVSNNKEIQFIMYTKKEKQLVKHLQEKKCSNYIKYESVRMFSVRRKIIKKRILCLEKGEKESLLLCLNLSNIIPMWCVHV